MRRSEIADLLWGDIRYNEDGSGIAIIRFAKGDQEGAGAAQWLSPRTMQALVAIRSENANPADRIFGLKGRNTIYERIRKAALAAGLGDGYSGHSLRVGMIYDMVDADIPRAGNHYRRSLEKSEHAGALHPIHRRRQGSRRATLCRQTPPDQAGDSPQTAGCGPLPG